MVEILLSLATIENIDASTIAWARRTPPWRIHIAAGEDCSRSGARLESAEAGAIKELHEAVVVLECVRC